VWVGHMLARRPGTRRTEGQGYAVEG
jgi:hypothetical protein